MSRKMWSTPSRTRGLRGRGGAGFPTGLKWSFTLPNPNSPKYIVCNADEGEPGTIKDRYIMEATPTGFGRHGHRRLCNRPRPMDIFTCAANITSPCTASTRPSKLPKQELLGDNIQGSGFSYHIKVHTGGGSYVCGEETALIESIEGKRGNPRSSRLSPASSGCGTNPPSSTTLSPWHGAVHYCARLRMVQSQGHRGLQGHQDLPGGGPRQ